jgi:hypothetical protein
MVEEEEEDVVVSPLMDTLLTRISFYGKTPKLSLAYRWIAAAAHLPFRMGWKRQLAVGGLLLLGVLSVWRRRQGK